MAKKQVDAEQLVDNLQNAKFGLSIQNIVAIVTVLSSLIAGWYTFTGRIDSLEEVVQGFAETSDIKVFEEYNSIGLGGVYDLGIINFKLGYYTESEFDVDYITLGGGIDTNIVDISLAYYYNTDSFHNETLMISFGFDL